MTAPGGTADGRSARGATVLRRVARTLRAVAARGAEASDLVARAEEAERALQRIDRPTAATDGRSDDATWSELMDDPSAGSVDGQAASLADATIVERSAFALAGAAGGDRRLMRLAADFFGAARKLGSTHKVEELPPPEPVVASGVFTAGRRPERAAGGDLTFALSYPGTDGAPWYALVETPLARREALRRHGQCCVHCGLQSAKYLQVLARDGRDWDPEALLPCCIFCALPLMVDLVHGHNAGQLIWAPELGQRDLSVLMQAIYLLRISQGPAADLARDLLERLKARSEGARSHFGSDQPRMLGRALGTCRTAGARAALLRDLPGLRLLPLDRRNVTEGDLMFNQFPQILAFWRSKSGPFAVGVPALDIAPLQRMRDVAFGPVLDWPH